MKRGRDFTTTYVTTISDAGTLRNQFSRLSSDIVRLICGHLISIADIVAFARTCKFTYRAIAPLFTIVSHSDHQWDGLCISIKGNIAPITVLRIIGASFYYLTTENQLIPAPLTELADSQWYFRHINVIKKALETPIKVAGFNNLYGAVYDRCIRYRGEAKWVKVVLQLQPDDAKYILREV